MDLFSKRYELAEKEYIASKMNLHKKSELKEQLTEHLYTIIHQNEVSLVLISFVVPDNTWQHRLGFELILPMIVEGLLGFL